MWAHGKFTFSDSDDSFFFFPAHRKPAASVEAPQSAPVPMS
jgi:hypothetical protein